MHEWALAEAVLESTRREARGRRVLRVVLRFGELQQVDRGIFTAAISELATEADIDPASFAIETEPARFACRRCGRSWTFADGPAMTETEREAVHFLPEAAYVYVRCPGCGSTDFDIASGRGVGIAAIELEEPGGGR